jgi:hypothetical protein
MKAPFLFGLDWCGENFTKLFHAESVYVIQYC